MLVPPVALLVCCGRAVRAEMGARRSMVAPASAGSLSPAIDDRKRLRPSSLMNSAAARVLGVGVFWCGCCCGGGLELASCPRALNVNTV